MIAIEPDCFAPAVSYVRNVQALSMKHLLLLHTSVLLAAGLVNLGRGVLERRQDVCFKVMRQCKQEHGRISLVHLNERVHCGASRSVLVVVVAFHGQRHRTPPHTTAHHRTPPHTTAHHRTPPHTTAHLTQFERFLAPVVPSVTLSAQQPQPSGAASACLSTGSADRGFCCTGGWPQPRCRRQMVEAVRRVSSRAGYVLGFGRRAFLTRYNIGGWDSLVEKCL